MEPLELLEESSPRVDFWDFLDFDFKKRFFFSSKNSNLFDLVQINTP